MAVVIRKNSPETQSSVRQTELRLDEKLQTPGKYELTPDDTFTVTIYLKKIGKRWILAVQDDPDACMEEVVFRMWSYDELIEMRKMATNYDSMKRMHMVDHDAMNRLKIQKLLKAWTFEKDNPRLHIHHVNGVMVDESWTAFTKLQPNIATAIIERMNYVLEANG